MSKSAKKQLSPDQLKQRSRWARLLTQASYVAMLLMMVLTSLPGQLPEQTSVALVLTIKLFPLLLVLPGVVMDSLRGYIWLCFVILLYFTQAVVEVFLSLGAFSDVFITFLSVVLFISAMLYVKWQRALGRSL